MFQQGGVPTSAAITANKSRVVRSSENGCIPSALRGQHSQNAYEPHTRNTTVTNMNEKTVKGESGRKPSCQSK